MSYLSLRIKAFDFFLLCLLFSNLSECCKSILKNDHGYIVLCFNVPVVGPYMHLIFLFFGRITFTDMIHFFTYWIHIRSIQKGPIQVHIFEIVNGVQTSILKYDLWYLLSRYLYPVSLCIFPIHLYLAANYTCKVLNWRYKTCHNQFTLQIVLMNITLGRIRLAG